jgi:hypothetical protein
MTNREVMRQARNSFLWNLNTDLDNITACEQWAKMLRKNIDALNKALAVPEPAQRPWQGLTDEDKQTAVWTNGTFGGGALWAEAMLKDRNG